MTKKTGKVVRQLPQARSPGRTTTNDDKTLDFAFALSILFFPFAVIFIFSGAIEIVMMVYIIIIFLGASVLEHCRPKQSSECETGCPIKVSYSPEDFDACMNRHDLHIGSLVTIKPWLLKNKLYSHDFVTKRERGRILGKSRIFHCVRVKWEGIKLPESISLSLITAFRGDHD